MDSPIGPDSLDGQVRLAAFDFLSQHTQLHGDVLPKTLLEKGFIFAEKRVPLIGPQGIFKPALLPDMPLSITTVPVVRGEPRPYNDEVGYDGLLKYHYRGKDPLHRDNVGLRRAMERKVPLIYLYGVIPGKYMPVWPVYIVRDDLKNLTFSVAIDDAQSIDWAHLTGAVGEFTERRQYITATVRQRLHQRSFRERVLMAYQEQCAICSLRHQELLDAAHILPDGHPKGDPIVPNGISLCKLHHAAFDRNIIGIRPDFVVEVRLDILQEHDGPMLTHGLQNFQGAPIHIPRPKDLRPNPDFLKERYAIFQASRP